MGLKEIEHVRLTSTLKQLTSRITGRLSLSPHLFYFISELKKNLKINEILF